MLIPTSQPGRVGYHQAFRRGWSVDVAAPGNGIRSGMVWSLNTCSLKGDTRQVRARPTSPSIIRFSGRSDQKPPEAKKLWAGYHSHSSHLALLGCCPHATQAGQILYNTRPAQSRLGRMKASRGLVNPGASETPGLHGRLERSALFQPFIVWAQPFV